MTIYACTKCNAPVCEMDEFQALQLLRFPDDLLSCYAGLKKGPGSAICPRCSHINTFPFLTLALAKGHAVLGVPENNPALTKLSKIARQQVAAKFPGRTIHLTRTVREFRRALLLHCVVPAGNLLNEFGVRQDKLTWVREHAAKLDLAFFSAIWLVGNGAVPVFTQELDQEAASLPNAFVPDEDAPERTAHVLARKAALEVHTNKVGELVATMLLDWAIRSHDQRSLQPFIDQAGAVVPSLILDDDDVLAAIASQLGEMREMMPEGRPGWIVSRYVIEAVLAILCHAHELPNPRKLEWTRIALFYDFMRRRDGNDESVLLAPELLRATLDEARFWQVFTELGKDAGLGQLSEENQADMLHLMDAAGRVYPDEMLAHLPMAIHHLASSDDKAVLAKSRKLLRDAFQPEHQLLLITAVFTGLRQQHPKLLRPAVETMIDDLEAQADLPLARRLAILRIAVEELNSSGQHRAGARAGERVLALLATPEAAGLDQVERAHMLNEVGNCMRYAGRLEDALALYDEALALLGGDTGRTDVRVGLRNRSIVMRDLHHYAAARDSFAKLMPLAGTSELCSLMVSQAACLCEMGMGAAARDMLESRTDLISGLDPNTSSLIEFASLLAYLRLQDGQKEAALQLLRPLLEPAQRRDYHFTDIVWQLAALRADPPDKAARSTAIKVLSELFSHMTTASMNSSIMATLVELDRAMTQDGLGERAEALLRDRSENADPAVCPHCWQLNLLAASHARRRGDSEQAELDLIAAMQDFSAGIANAAAVDDILTFTSPLAAMTTDLVRQAIAQFGDNGNPYMMVARLAADLRCAPILTSRLRHMAGLPAPLDDPDEESERLRQLLRETPAVLLQAVGTGDEVVLLRTWLDSDGELDGDVLHLGISDSVAGKIVSRLAFALAVTPPGARELNLQQVRGWQRLADGIRAGLAGLPDGLPLAIASGPLQEAAFSLAIEGARPLCFVPSLGALAALRERRRQTAQPAAGQRTLFTFATWFDQERPVSARALAEVAAIGARLADSKRLTGIHASGVEATGKHLLDGLAQADVAWLACHGHISRDAESVDLYVAAHGSLPPVDLSMINKSLRDAHIVNWQALAGLERAPPLVVSSACDSGLTHTNAGGERLGLERPLFCAGTLAFVAPMWPVPTCDIQPRVAGLLEQYLGVADAPLVGHVWRVRQDSVAADVPRLAAEALAVFGDAL